MLCLFILSLGGFSLALGLKDVSLVSQAARETDTPMPFLSVLLDRFGDCCVIIIMSRCVYDMYDIYGCVCFTQRAW